MKLNKAKGGEKSMLERGINTDRHHAFRTYLNDVEVKMAEKIKKHYGFKSDRQLIVALIKRAFMNITIK